MTREADFATRMTSDATLMAILTGGVFKSELVGREGITRESAASAFDGSGYLKPCALVRQRGRIPGFDVVDHIAQVVNTVQIVEVWLYADAGAGYTAIDSAVSRIFYLFQGYVMTGSFEIRLASMIERERDNGALAGAGMARMDWQVDSILSA